MDYDNINAGPGDYQGCGCISLLFIIVLPTALFFLI